MNLSKLNQFGLFGLIILLVLANTLRDEGERSLGGFATRTFGKVKEFFKSPFGNRLGKGRSDLSETFSPSSASSQEDLSFHPKVDSRRVGFNGDADVIHYYKGDQPFLLHSPEKRPLQDELQDELKPMSTGSSSGDQVGDDSVLLPAPKIDPKSPMRSALKRPVEDPQIHARIERDPAKIRKVEQVKTVFIKSVGYQFPPGIASALRERAENIVPESQTAPYKLQELKNQAKALRPVIRQMSKLQVRINRLPNLRDSLSLKSMLADINPVRDPDYASKLAKVKTELDKVSKKRKVVFSN